MRRLILFLFLPVLAWAQMPGYSVPATGIGLTVCIGPGNNTISGALVTYAGSCLGMTQNATNFGYLDSVSGILTLNTSGAPSGACPIFEADTDYFQVNAVRDKRPQLCSGGGGGGSVLGTDNTWGGINTFTKDLKFSPVGGPNLYYNRAISTSLYAPVNHCQNCLGPTDPIAYGCVSCDSAKTLTGDISTNGLILMNLIRGNGVSGPSKLCDYLGCLLGYGPAGSQMVSSNQSGNSDLDGEVTMSGGTFTYPFVNSYTSHPICTANSETAIAAVKVTYTGTTSVTFTTSGASDVVGYICHGRN